LDLAREEFDSLTDTGNDRRQPTEGIVERREHTRYAVDAWAEVMVKDGTLLFRGRVLDISLGGCYVETEARLRLAPGTPVEMIFRMGERVFRCDGSSRAVRPGQGAGFVFGSLEPRMQWELEMLIRRLEGEDTGLETVGG
jgi:hypothetical protein